MEFRYLPTTEEDRQQMLADIGIKSVQELFEDIPESIRYHGEMNLPQPMDEYSLKKHMQDLASQNASTQQMVSFLGAGVYEHYIPSVVDHMISRSEFYTAYTPYQPEISQGELQAVFEFQTMICELTGMDVANSSMYDGYTALAEAATMAVGQGKANKIIISRAVHPQSRQIIQTYARALGIQLIEIGLRDGRTDVEQLAKEADDNTAAVLVQSPNFFGITEDLATLAEITHSTKHGLFVTSVNPLSLGLLKPPGEFGADVVVGDAQPFGIPQSFGGPHCGFFAVKSKLMRKIPGRLVGQTKDEQGRRGFVLTLQAREQHIRREKASSNICSNQALNAVAASVAMTALGKHGIQEMARLNVSKAQYAYKQLCQLDGVQGVYDHPFFNEFVVRMNGSAADIEEQLLSRGFIPGYHLGRDYPELADHWLITVTEIRQKEEIDQFVQEVGRIVHG